MECHKRRTISIQYIIVGLILLFSLGMSTRELGAQCKVYFGGQWDIRQGNGIDVTMDVKQTGDAISGSAWYGEKKIERGTLTGTVERSGTRGWVNFQIKWGYGETGVYRGEWNQTDFRLVGTAFINEDAANDKRATRWALSGILNGKSVRGICSTSKYRLP